MRHRCSKAPDPRWLDKSRMSSPFETWERFKMTAIVTLTVGLAPKPPSPQGPVKPRCLSRGFRFTETYREETSHTSEMGRSTPGPVSRLAISLGPIFPFLLDAGAFGQANLGRGF